MPITTVKKKFTKQSVEEAPDKPGVYGLYDAKETIYIGHGESVRNRLQSHLAGNEGSCTKAAIEFNVELCTEYEEREEELVDEHTRKHKKPPRCNKVTN